jgi:hypothetical protein
LGARPAETQRGGAKEVSLTPERLELEQPMVWWVPALKGREVIAQEQQPTLD